MQVGVDAVFWLRSIQALKAPRRAFAVRILGPTEVPILFYFSFFFLGGGGDRGAFWVFFIQGPPNTIPIIKAPTVGFSEPFHRAVWFRV